MKVDVLERISEELQVPISYWFDEENNYAPRPSNRDDKAIAKRIDEITDGLKFLLNHSLNGK